jgi:phenylacetate-CoA ligase
MTAISGFDLLAHERLGQADLRALQLERLRWSLRQAARNPAYARKWHEAGVNPEDLRGIDDLRRFPFTTKDDLRAAYPFGFFAEPMEQVVRVHASSGTTGKPTVVGYTREDIEIWAGLCARSLYAAGARPGMRVHVAYGYGLFTGGLGLHYGAEALGCTVIPISGGQTERQVQLITDFKPDVICVTPSYMLAILDGFRKAGSDPRASSLRIGVFGAEPWTEPMRREIETSFDLTATDIYGLSEVMGPGVAQENGQRRDGPTIWEDHFYPEIVDPDSGEPLRDGEEGELVFTSLSKRAMPVIRYRTRDRTRLVPPGSGAMRRMTKISGRTDDMLIVRGVNLFPSQIEELLLQVPGCAPHYRLELTRPGRLDELSLDVEIRGGCEQEAVVDLLGARIRDRLGISVLVRPHPEGALERSAGKAVRVVDRRC